MRQGGQGLQAGFLSPQLQIRDVVLVQTGLLSQIQLTPAAIPPELPYSLSEQVEDVACHPYYRRVRLTS